MPTCEIKWIDKAGLPTPDTNTAVGRVRLPARVVQIAGHGATIGESRWFYICQCHKERLSEPGMHHWVFEALLIED